MDKLSVIIPARNESENLQSCICNIVEMLKKSKINHEILIIDEALAAGDQYFIVKSLEKIKEIYVKSAVNVLEIDGLSMCFKDWRFNLRQSNTENLLRLNVESRASKEVLNEKKLELLNLINLW